MLHHQRLTQVLIAGLLAGLLLLAAGCGGDKNRDDRESGKEEPTVEEKVPAAGEESQEHLQVQEESGTNTTDEQPAEDAEIPQNDDTDDLSQEMEDGKTEGETVEPEEPEPDLETELEVGPNQTPWG